MAKLTDAEKIELLKQVAAEAKENLDKATCESDDVRRLRLNLQDLIAVLAA